MIEARIYKRPDISLVNWFITGSLNVAILFGFTKRLEPWQSGWLMYYDAESQVVLDEHGMLFHLPPDKVSQAESEAYYEVELVREYQQVTYGQQMILCWDIGEDDQG